MVGTERGWRGGSTALLGIHFHGLGMFTGGKGWEPSMPHLDAGGHARRSWDTWA